MLNVYEHHPLKLLCEGEFIVRDAYQNIESERDGRIWSCLKDAFRVTRRYSIVAGEISILALNIIFLIAKADPDVSKKVGQVTLLLLSCVGLLALPYYVDVVGKAVQDTRFAAHLKNKTITSLATLKLLQMGSNVALTAGSFFAAVQGALGHEKEQTRSYKNMILWGEITLGTGVGLTLFSLYVTSRTKKILAKEAIILDPAIAANIRFCMDKDTLWHLIDKIKESESSYDSAMEVVKKNIDTQLKVTLGGKLALTLVGDALQAVEKVYTPNSLVSAVINCSVSFAYAVKILAEKCLEYKQRALLDNVSP